MPGDWDFSPVPGLLSPEVRLRWGRLWLSLVVGAQQKSRSGKSVPEPRQEDGRGGESRTAIALYLGLGRGERRNSGGGVRQGTEKGFGVPTGSEGTPSPQELEEKEVGEGWS